MPAFDARSIGLEAAPPIHVEPYTGTDRTVQAMEKLAAGERGEQAIPLRLVVEDIIRQVPARDQLSQIAAIYNWFLPRYTFVPDPPKVEYVKDPMRMLAEIAHRGRCLGDCDDASTFFLAAPRTIGIQTRLARAGFRKPVNGRQPSLTHVLAVARDQHGHGIVLDPVAGVRTREMLGRITRMK
jgi:transglutaminase-like putative cysteine protease